mmetsp:Transcript_32883/g.60050  ORF Transcript_32883/g.60050 Transcript_32883/m.60050 type:complete len:345 (-) Transcript_32883:89-1123(-)
MSNFNRCQKAGDALPTSPEGLREAGNAAVAKNEFTLACHMYTLGIDLASRELARDAEGHVDNSSGSLFVANQSTGGELVKLLANRSLCHLRLGDSGAALDDANASVGCDPTWEKAHLRVLAALEESQAPASSQLSACERGIAACLGAQGKDGSMTTLDMKLGRLKSLALAEAKNAEAARAASPPEVTTAAVPTSPSQTASSFPPGTGGGDPLFEAKRVAELPDHPRHAVACSDLGAAFACGAHGVERDAVRAERLLAAGAQGGDLVASRNLGLLLLQLGRPAEAAEHLSVAASGGDQEAKGTLAELAIEAEAKTVEAQAQLRMHAARGDVRAISIMRELGLEEE